MSGNADHNDDPVQDRSRDAPYTLTKTLEMPVLELARGSVFAGRYEVIEELGSGGMGKVYRVEDTKIKEEVALKILRPEFILDKRNVERFSNELKMARRISHKNVCRMYHFGEEQGLYFITMEYVEGEDLKRTMRRVGPLGGGKAVFIAKQVCCGLEEAHGLGVIHRDLKPQNIMIDKEGNVRIMDFGIAKFLKSEGITASGAMIGTPEYMSPEQVQGEDVDPRSDIYSLGIILYEMVTGRVPFEGDTTLSVALKHRTETAKNPREFNEHIPIDLSSAIMKCLEKNMERRYQKAGDFQAELTRIEKDIPSTERVLPKRKPLTSREITVRFSLKRLVVPSMFLLGLVLGGAVVWRFLPRSEHAQIMVQKSEAAGQPRNDLELGQEDWNNKNYAEALAHFKTAVEKDPQNYGARLSVANILKELGKSEEAIAEYEKAVALNSLDVRAFEQLAALLKEKRDLEKAKSYYLKYLQSVPESPKSREFEAMIREIDQELLAKKRAEMRMKEPSVISEKKIPEPGVEEQKAIPSPKAVLPALPEEAVAEKVDISALLASGISAYDRGDYDGCLEQLSQILEVDPAHGQALKYRDLTQQKITTGQIQSIVQKYIDALDGGNLSAFYEAACTTEFYEKIKKDVEVIVKSYNQLQSLASDIKIQLEGSTKSTVEFFHIITGVSNRNQIKEVLFEGVYLWEMENRDGVWKIIKIASRRGQVKKYIL